MHCLVVTNGGEALYLSEAQKNFPGIAVNEMNWQYKGNAYHFGSIDGDIGIGIFRFKNDYDLGTARDLFHSGFRAGMKFQAESLKELLTPA